MHSLKHYVEYLVPGALCCESIVREIGERDPDMAVCDAPPNCYGFRFYDHSYSGWQHDHVVNASGMYYFGELLTEKDVEEKVSDNKMLLLNMRGNGWKYVCRTRLGNFVYFAENRDAIVNLSPKPKVVSKAKGRILQI